MTVNTTVTVATELTVLTVSDSENVTNCVILSKLINSHQADEKNTDHLKWILMTKIL